MKKKSLIACLMLISLLIAISTLASAQNKIKVSVTKSTLQPGENLALTVLLDDSEGNPLNAEVSIVIEDLEKTAKIEKTIMSNRPTGIDLGENTKWGDWTITASYKDENGVAEEKSVFSITKQELMKFEIDGDKLSITNIGNARYSTTIQVIIGETPGTKNVALDIGETTSFRLIAPDGNYNIRITDGRTTLSKENVKLTGNVIGILDEGLEDGGSPVTGGVKPEEEEEGEDLYYALRSKRYVYIFLLAVIGAAILLAIERNYRKKI